MDSTPGRRLSHGSQGLNQELSYKKGDSIRDTSLEL
jgi:hypothetical protein